MRSSKLKAGVLLACAAMIAHAAVAQPAPLPALGLPLNGARLGMTLDAWRALPWAGPDAAHVAADCTPEPSSKGAPGSPALAGGALVACRYVARYGAYTLPEPLPLGGGFRLRQPVFQFVDGRLTEIRAYSSIDAFSLLMARLQKTCEAPLKIARDEERFADGERLPRVRAMWRIPAGLVVLDDPSKDPQLLAISIRSAPQSGSRIG